MKQIIGLWLLATVLVFTACKAGKNKKTDLSEAIEIFETVDSTEMGEDWEAYLDNLSDLPERAPYRATNKRSHDIISTSLDIRFDWERQFVMGKAIIKAQPVFYASNTLELDAQNFIIEKVGIAGGTPLKFDYIENKTLRIELDKTYKKGEQYTIEINYTARPNMGEAGGSAAITSEKGLFFINPKGEDPEVPKQIWSQGETENNSRWFPTIDKPNERMLSDITLTVPSNMKTLSNGLMVKSTPNADSTRTDYWVMDQPHAPYLVMIAVGDFAMVSDKWNGINVDYYVEPEFEGDARAIFPYTTELLQFYSDVLGVKYPWKKYSQIVVREYVSGAMENTTAVIFGDYMQQHKGDLVDVQTNELVVAHEMFHHWFGDYVTCESWSNLTLNEGFANYSEYLWLEHKHGKDAAEAHRYSEREGYLRQAAEAPHPLIDFHYADKENMFDAHSYNKGGLVLHMLRKYVGDEAFFASLKYYLEKNAYTDVEVDELRMAFEDVTGEDLNWFFDQWYLQAGHPVLEIQKEFIATENAYRLTVMQVQDGNMDVPEVFNFPVDILIVNADGTRRTETVRVEKGEQTFTFKVNGAPQGVYFDPEHIVLCTFNTPEVPSDEERFEMINQYTLNPSFDSRFTALNALPRADTDKKPAVVPGSVEKKANALVATALNDPFHGIRGMAVERVQTLTPEITATLAKMATTDGNADVRVLALERLAAAKDKAQVAVFQNAIEKDSVFRVVMAGLSALNELDSVAAMASAAKLENTQSTSILLGLSDIYQDNGAVNKLDFLEKSATKVNGYPAINYLINYALLAEKADPARLEKGINWLLPQLKNASFGSKLGAFAALSYLSEGIGDIRVAEQVTASLQKAITNETNAQLSEAMGQIQMMMMMMRIQKEE